MKTALHSISYSGTWGQPKLTINQVIDRAAAMGYDGVMLAAKRPHVSLLDLGRGARQELKAKLLGSGVTLACLAGYTNFTADGEHPEIPHREMQAHYVGELCRLAVELGGRVVRIFTGYEHPSTPYSRAWEQTVEAVRDCTRLAADAGAVLVLQNHHDLGAHHQSLLQLLRAVDNPSCRAAFDAWAPALQGEDLAAVARALAPSTGLTTVADYVRLPRWRYRPELVNYVRDTDYVQAVPIGEGFIDYRGFFSALRDGGYDGFVTYEMCSPLRDGSDVETLDRYAKKFVEFMRPWTASPTAGRQVRPG
jgi:sugar phosphate isomerase/epimerase